MSSQKCCKHNVRNRHFASTFPKTRSITHHLGHTPNHMLTTINGKVDPQAPLPPKNIECFTTRNQWWNARYGSKLKTWGPQILVHANINHPTIGVPNVDPHSYEQFVSIYHVPPCCGHRIQYQNLQPFWSNSKKTMSNLLLVFVQRHAVWTPNFGWVKLAFSSLNGCSEDLPNDGSFARRGCWTTSRTWTSTTGAAYQSLSFWIWKPLVIKGASQFWKKTKYWDINGNMVIILANYSIWDIASKYCGGCFPEMYSPLVLTGMIPKCTPTFSQIRRFKKKQPPKRIQKIYISNRWLMLDICHCFFCWIWYNLHFFCILFWGFVVWCHGDFHRIRRGKFARNSLQRTSRQAMEVVSSQLMIVSTSLMSIIDNS
jgi:hypothetical protein